MLDVMFLSHHVQNLTEIAAFACSREYMVSQESVLAKVLDEQLSSLAVRQKHALLHQEVRVKP